MKPDNNDSSQPKSSQGAGGAGIKPFRGGKKTLGGTQFPGGTAFPGFDASGGVNLATSVTLTTHKIRADWFQQRVSFPLRDPTAANLRALLEYRRTRPLTRSSLEWKAAGPSNIGGRVTSLVVDPDDTARAVAGTAAGGVWRTEDAGRSWRPVWGSDLVNLNIGVLACDPNDARTIYCGTGEANLSADNYPGDGVYVSRDGGDTWNLFGSIWEHRLPHRIGTIAVDPADPNCVWVGGITHAETDPGGIFVTRDGGRKWKRLNHPQEAGAIDHLSGRNYWCYSILFSTSKPGRVFVSVDARGSLSGLWRSDDYGKTWEQLTTGLPPGESFGRTSIAMCAQKPDTLYALAADRRDGVLGVFRTDNAGATWRSIGWNHFEDESQLSYCNCIAVHPANADDVICGGINLHRTTDGGATWLQITDWYAPFDDPTYAHSDHHSLVITADGRVFDGNDGGVAVSDDGGRTWRTRSNGLEVTMFYDADVATMDANCYGGGTQDNGTVVTETGLPHDFNRVLGGDGGWMLYTRDDPQQFFASCQRMQIYRYTRISGWENITPDDASRQERRSVWMAYLALAPYDLKATFGTVLYAGSTRVWRSQDNGESWQSVSPVLDGSPISAIEVHSSDPRAVYVGTVNGGVFRSLDGGNNWSENIAGPLLPGRIVTRLETFPTDPAKVVAVIGCASEDKRFSHVFFSNNAGKSWFDIDGGRLPNAPHHAIAIESGSNQRVFIAGDAGVFMTEAITEDKPGHFAATWYDATGNLPNVIVTDLVYHAGTNTLTAATYGRSLWRARLAATTEPTA